MAQGYGNKKSNKKNKKIIIKKASVNGSRD
jgi:hypothetical protein